jgi:MYXO-CTERM domain-containing protein
MTVMCIAERLLDDAELLQAIDVHVIPVLNPDGYVYSWQGDRYWRKNTRGGYGVDLNRNWGYAWGGAGASPNPSDENYHGDGPFSEPETQIVRDWMVAHPDLVAHIDFHSYAELVIYPWGYGYEAAPDEPQLSSLAGAIANAASATHGHGFQPIQGADFYPAAGAVDDWAYGEEGLMSFTIELRGNDFVIAPSNIVPSCEESLAGTMELAAWTAEHSDVVDPPDGGTGTSGDDGGAGTIGGDDGGTPPGSEGGEADDGEAGSDGGADDDDGSHGGPGAVDPWLPPGYGMTAGPGSCACTTGSGGAPVFVLVLLLATRRRSLHGTK